MTSRIGRLFVCGTVAALLGGLASTVPSASAAPAQPALVAPDMPPEALAEYRTHWPDVPVADLYARLRLMPARKALLGGFSVDDADTFGGSWYDLRTGEWHLYATTPAAAAVMAAKARAVGLTPATRVVPYSFAALFARAKRIGAGHDPMSRISRQAGVDVLANKVTVAAARSRRTVHDPMVAYVDPAPKRPVGSGDQVCTTRRDCGSPMRSGIILWKDNYSNPQCSLGFVAGGLDGSKWVLTAGHCLNPGTTSDVWGHGGQTIGTAGQCWYPEPTSRCIDTDDADFGRIRITNSYWLSGGFGWVFNPTGPSTPVEIHSAETNRLQMEYGDVVCVHAWHVSHEGTYDDVLPGLRSSFMTDSDDNCGTIVSVVSATNYDMPVVGSVDVCKGDSGGAWLLYPGDGTRMAVGLHQGRPTPYEPEPAPGSPTPFCNEYGYARFTPLDAVNARMDAYSSTTIRVITR